MRLKAELNDHWFRRGRRNVDEVTEEVIIIFFSFFSTERLKANKMKM